MSSEQESFRHAINLVKQAHSSINETAPEVVLGSPHRGPWWESVEELRQAGERLSSACKAIQEKF